MAKTLAAPLVVALSLLGCGSGDPVPGHFTIDFPTVADAVATSTVQVLVYPFDQSTTSCQALFEQRRTTMMSPPPTASTSPVSPCALTTGGASLPVGFGDFSFLAIAQAGGQDFLVGCAAETISDTNSVVQIELTLETNTETVATTSCTSLSEFCSKKCK